MFEKILGYLNGIPDDKTKHLGGGYVIATALPFSPLVCLFLALLCGILKEIYDYCHQDKHTVDRYDCLATWAGGVLGFIAMVIK